MKHGDRIEWGYYHSLGRSRVWRSKAGIFIAKTRHTVKHWRKYGAVQMAYVQFDGNKTMSQVPLKELIV